MLIFIEYALSQMIEAKYIKNFASKLPKSPRRISKFNQGYICLT